MSSCPVALNTEGGDNVTTMKEQVTQNNRVSLDNSSISDTIMKNGRNEITAKLYECNLNTASNIAEQLKNMFVAALTKCNGKLTTLYEQQQEVP